jgi:hypothetical protein
MQWPNVEGNTEGGRNKKAILTDLAPPATEQEIPTLRNALNGSTIEVLEAWYKWHNGSLSQNTWLLPLGHPLTIKEALEDRKMIQAIPFVDKLRKNSLKILDDGAGDGFFLDVTAKNPTVFYAMLEDPTPRHYGTLVEFINFIAQGFEEGALSVEEKGDLKWDKAKYKALEKEHFKKIDK